MRQPIADTKGGKGYAPEAKNDLLQCSIYSLALIGLGENVRHKMH